jgi:hypothetical protein
VNLLTLSAVLASPALAWVPIAIDFGYGQVEKPTFVCYSVFAALCAVISVLLMT